jgi:hypothetical protein
MAKRMSTSELERWASLLPDSRLAFIAEAGRASGYTAEQIRAAKAEIESRADL